MSMIKSAQARESKAQAAASRLISETTRATKEELAAADLKARSILTSAESRGRKYIQAAESEAEEKVAEAETEAEELLEKSKREVTALTYAAKREGERIISTATGEITNYRQWLNGAIAEAERLYRIQKQALESAESSIQQSRNRLDGAFQKLEELQKSILENLNPNDTLINSGPLRVSSQRTQSALTAPKKTAKKSVKKSAGQSSKKKTTKK
jgi:tetrahydromethanopterin S-methyltransferase subunit B